MVFIALGFGLSTYLIMSGFALLEKEEVKTTSMEKNAS